MNCSSCGAPLPAKSLVCPFCSTRNAVDLRGLSVSTGKAPAAPRACPECRAGMESLNVGRRERFFIEMCPRCHGLFFDLNELHALLDDAVVPTYEIDYPLLAKVQEESPAPRRAAYVPCPDCAKLMNKVQFAPRSGVVIDRCRDHGIWLEGGELRRLMEWKKAGGQVMEQRRQHAAAEDARAEGLIQALTEKKEASSLIRQLDQLFRGINEL
jgi:Zn-finger nucleic acid-binding protein